MLLFSKPHQRAAPQRYRHGATHHLRPHRVGQVCTTSICELLPSCANSPPAEILQAIHSQFCHTALYKEIYSWSRSGCTQCLRVFQVVLLSRIQTSVPGKYGSKAFQLALHDRSGSFFRQCVAEQFVQSCYCKDSDSSSSPSTTRSSPGQQEASPGARWAKWRTTTTWHGWRRQYAVWWYWWLRTLRRGGLWASLYLYWRYTVYVFIHSAQLYFIIHMYYTHILLFLYDIVKDKNTK